MSDEIKKPAYVVFSHSREPTDGPIGFGYEMQEGGGITIVVDALPLSGKIECFRVNRMRPSNR